MITTMKKALSSATFAALTTLIAIPHPVQAGIYSISDDRVRNLDSTPTLGRGYSIMTNSFQSTCMNAQELSIPSFNYDYSFYDFVSNGLGFEVDLGAFAHSFGYWWLKDRMTETAASDNTRETTTYYTAASMRIERYYSSIREELSTLNDAAVTLLEMRDYVGFFKACGPNYVRSIRRAQEVVAFFTLESTSQEIAGSFAQNLSAQRWGGASSAEWSTSTQYAAITQKMRISILGYGLGLTEDGSETLLATTVEEFDQVMTFAWKTMTSSPNAVHIGMVYGIEIMPWVQNLAFQVTSGVFDEVVEVPLNRNLIPHAYPIDKTTSPLFDNDTNRNLFRCKLPSHQIDMNGQCCEAGVLYDPELNAYDETNANERYCRPFRRVESAIVAENVASNGEFVARLDRALRFKINQMASLEKCISAVRAIPSRFDFRVLKPKASITSSNSFKVTVFEMKKAMDPFNDFAALQTAGYELEEFIDMFYQPCLAAIYGTNIGTSPSTDVKYFLAYPWHYHNECKYLSCFGNGMRWDRVNGGCTPGLLSGGEASYVVGDAGDNPKNCKKAVDSFGDTEVCAQSEGTLMANQQKLVSCMKVVQGSSNYLAFLENYCLPEVTDESVGNDVQLKLREDSLKHCTCTDAETTYTNVALGKPAYQSSTWNNDKLYQAGNAVDGNTDGSSWRGSTIHTKYRNGNWWYVTLGSDPIEISRIKVYNRNQWTERLNGAKLKCMSGGTIVEERSLTNDLIQEFDFDDILCDTVRIENDFNYLQVAEVEVYKKVITESACPVNI